MYVQLSPVPANVSLARERVTRFGQAMGVSSSRLDDVAVAVSEAVTNAFTAHRDANSTETVELMAAIEDGRTLTVTVIDQGPGFVAPPQGQATSPAPNSPDEIGDGLGLTVMRQLADEIDFVRSEGMTVSLRFHLGSSLPP